MTGGYPCCCEERFGSSLSGVESGVLPPAGSLVLSCPCECLCGELGPESLRVDLHVPDDRLADCQGGNLEGRRCSELSGTYFIRCHSDCYWTNQEDPELSLSIWCATDWEGKWQVGLYLELLSWSCGSLSGGKKVISFSHEFLQEELEPTPTGYCLDVSKLHGVVLNYYPWSTWEVCPVPNATATLYLP